MGTYKLVLDDDINYDFTLIAIHCSSEAYHLAFLLNKYLKIKLMRRRNDIRLRYNGGQAGFALFEFHDDYRYMTYQLIQNKTKAVSQATPSIGLFEAESNSATNHFFMQELHRVDYMLRIIDDGAAFAKAKTLTTLNQISQIVTAYTVDVASLKAKENLIIE